MSTTKKVFLLISLCLFLTVSTLVGQGQFETVDPVKEDQSGDQTYEYSQEVQPDVSQDGQVGSEFSDYGIDVTSQDPSNQQIESYQIVDGKDQSQGDGYRVYGKVIQDGIWRCKTNQNCQKGDACINGQCLPKVEANLPTCRMACPDGYRCIDGGCKPFDQCSLIRCRSGYRCVRGKCEKIGTTSPINKCAAVLCPENTKCQNGKCIPFNKCALVRCKQGYKCIDGDCIPSTPIDKCAAVLCPENTKCQNGKCIPFNKCALIRCREGYRCVDGDCVKIQDTIPLPIDKCTLILCVPGTQCVNGKCVDIIGKYCASDLNCGDTQICKSGKCIDVCPKALCAYPQICKQGKCINPPNSCLKDTECGLQQICLKGVCFNRCKTTKCAGGQTCIHGKCITQLGACWSENDCPYGRRCVDGKCEEKCWGKQCPVSGCPDNQGLICMLGRVCNLKDCVPDVRICPGVINYGVKTCTLPRPDEKTCQGMVYIEAPPYNFCGITKTGERISFIRQCQACKNPQILYYLPEPCHKAPFTCTQSEICLDNKYCSKKCLSQSQCRYNWQTCVNGQCVDRCNLLKCHSCKYGQCGYQQPQGKCSILRGIQCKNQNWDCIGGVCMDRCERTGCEEGKKCENGDCVKEVKKDVELGAGYG